MAFTSCQATVYSLSRTLIVNARPTPGVQPSNMSPMLFSLSAVALTMVLLATSASAAPPTGEVPAAEIDRIAALLLDRPFAFGPAVSDRAAWDKLAQHKAFASILPAAEKLLSEPMPELTDDIYREYVTTGNRTKHYGDVRGARHNRIATLTLAECIVNKGRFIPALETAIASICAEPTWVFNFHDPNLANWQGKVIQIDLGSILPAHAMAQAQHMLGDRLSEQTRALMAATCRQRILDPYRESVIDPAKAGNCWFIRNENNWNSVCHAGVLGTALVFAKDAQERAFFAASTVHFSRRYIDSFGKDAYCQEGLGYWSYGFSNYILICELLHQATGGKLDLYQEPGVREVALFPVRARIAPGVWPAYADCSVGATPSFQLMAFLNRRYGLGLDEWKADDQTTAAGGLPTAMMFSAPNSATARARPWPTGARSYHELRTHFVAPSVIHFRPAAGDTTCRLSASIKGGHNAEAHGHTDMGTFIVVLGKDPLILDPGLEVYTARTFSKDRFKSNLLNSFGHPVPRVAGQLQTPGREYHATILSTSFTDATDTCTMDLKPAYSVPSLTKLTRTFTYTRTSTGQFTVTDDVTFSSPQQFGTALITYGQWQQQPDGSLLISQNGETIKITIDTAGQPLTISSEPINENNGKGTKPTRIALDLTHPVPSARITLTITPN